MVAIPAWLLAPTILNGVTSLDLRSAEALGYVQPVTVDDDGFGSIGGPYITSNFPDPAIIHVDGVSYAFATRDKNKPVETRYHVQVATSTDNLTWTLLNQDAMPTVGAWGTGNSVWAPDVIRRSDGKFVLYFADEPKIASSKHCVGAAVSDTILGPYKALDTALACPDPKTLGGAIDPEGFHDQSTGRRYVIYKVDGNSIGHGGLCSNMVDPIVPTPLMLQEVDSGDGVTLVGDAVELFRQDQENGPLIEAPAMHRSKEGIYFLFYSSNCFTTPGYDVEYATATNIKGPWQKNNTRLLHTGDGPNLTGPGGLDIIADGTMVVFHGILNMSNSKAYKRQVQAKAKTSGKTARQVAAEMPLMRGLYTATATFSGRHVSL